jgi:8-oxo-dGTP diphosphatase
VHDGRLLVARRAAGSHLAGAWEFPGGKIRAGEAPAAAAARELAEETGLRAGRLEPVCLVVHEYPERTVRLHAFLARTAAGQVRIDGDRPWAWKTLDELGGLGMPPADEPILRALRSRLSR